MILIEETNEDIIENKEEDDNRYQHQPHNPVFSEVVQ